MDPRAILDQLLSSGKQMLNQGRDVAERQVGVPAAGDERGAMLSGLGKGAAAGGLLALLLGTRTGRRVTGKVIKYGSIAAVAAVAYKAFQAWQEQAKSPTVAGSQPLSNLSGQQASERGLLLLRAMIAAANADGQIDAMEQAHIREQLDSLKLGDEATRMLREEIARPVDVATLARQVDSPATAAEVYLLSSLIADDTNAAERDYLKRLAAAMKLPGDLVSHLEAGSVA